MPKTYAEVQSLLQQHRAQKAAAEKREQLKRKLRQPWRLLYRPEDSAEDEMGEEQEQEEEEEEEKAKRLLAKQARKERRQAESRPLTPAEKRRRNIRIAAKIVTWFGLWIFFIYIEFGAVYFIFSIAYFMYTNLGNRREGPSAYSVFNDDCERLQGTFTAEDFDSSLRTGMGIVR